MLTVGGLNQGYRSLPATRLKTTQVQPVTWIPAAQPEICLDWERGKKRVPYVLQGPPKRGKNNGGAGGSCSGQVLYLVLLLLS